MIIISHSFFVVFCLNQIFQLDQPYRTNKAGWLSQRSFEDRLSPELAASVDEIIAKSDGAAEET